MRSPATSWFDCRQNITSARSRKYQPLPTIPCSRGSRPVRIVDCAEQVTAGSTVPSGRRTPLGEAREMGRVGPELLRRESDDVENDERLGHE